MNVDAVKSTIKDGIRAAEQCRTTIKQASADAAEGTILARQATRGTNHSEVSSALAMLAEATHETELVQRRLTGCVDAAGEYLTALG